MNEQHPINPALPDGAPAMPEVPEAPSSAELHSAVMELRSEIGASLRTGMTELAAALKPGANVRDLASDSIKTWTTIVNAAPSQLVVPAFETRTKVTLWTLAAGLFIHAEPGVAPGELQTGVELIPNTPLDIDTRAALYASAVGGPLSLRIVVQSAVFYA